MQPLIPTLWRTCRVLANPQRLRCLRQVSLRPGRCVSEIAAATGVPVAVASQYLRDLQARGLIAVRRRSRWAFYDPEADSSVGHAATMLASARAAAKAEDWPYPKAVPAFAAFAHPRRLAIIRSLRSVEPAGLSAIGRNTGIGERALLRHLADLAHAGVVRGVGRKWKLARRLPPLLGALVRETCR
jgi:DNA-binding transcriptional ArsR family regulator